MQNKYQALLRHSEQRLLAGRGRLAQRHHRLVVEQGECHRLQGEIELQRQLAQAGALDGTELSRQQLFGWLRKSAADQHRSQALRLELHRQEEVISDCVEQVEVQRTLCQRLQGRRDRYQTLLQQERKKNRLRQLNIEEYELEERVSWSK